MGCLCGIYVDTDGSAAPILDLATAQGWALNDDDQWFYYKDGKALTGTQTIRGVKYFFDFDGKLRGETDT